MKTKNTRDVRVLEEELKKRTGENKLSKGIDVEIDKKAFNVRRFLKLAKEMRKIFSEDERHTNPAL